MAFRYSCFISYRQGEGELTQTFIRELEKTLSSYIEPWLEEKVFLDQKKMQAGDYLDRNLAEALCQSVCMILVFTPKYFSQKFSYCTREFLAMEKLEEERYKKADIPPRKER